MQKLHPPPRPPAERLFSWAMIGGNLLQGGIAFALLAMIYGIAIGQGLAVEHVRTLVFFALIAAIVALVLADRTTGASITAGLGRKNVALAVVLVSMVTIAAAIMLVPGIAALLRLSVLNCQDWAVAIDAGVILFLLFQLMKLLSIPGRWATRFRAG